MPSPDCPVCIDSVPENPARNAGPASRRTCYSCVAKLGEIVPKRLARDEVVMSDVSHRNPRAYDRRKK